MVSDQAQLLRQMVENKGAFQRVIRPMHIITVTSGKGGVGKSNFSVNLAIALKKMGKAPIIVDADLGLANVEIILGEMPRYNLSHLIKRECDLKKLITPTSYGIYFISGGTGIREMSFLSKEQIISISQQLRGLDEFTDTLIIDTGAGINDTVIKCCELADQIYTIVTPEPTSMTDGYALIKTLLTDINKKPNLKLVINKVENQQEAQHVFHKLNQVSQRFLDYPIGYGGFIPYDETLFKAVKQQIPVMNYAPHTKASLAYSQIAKVYLNSMMGGYEERQERTDWIHRFKRLFTR